MEKLKIKLLRPAAQMPRRATDGAAGYDLAAAISAPMAVKRGEITVIPTGVAIALEPGYVALAFGRSGLGFKHGVVPANAVGVIDSDYRGEISIALTCQLEAGYTVHPGERVAQLLIVPVATPALERCQELDETVRGVSGFGSTGKN